MPIVAKDMGEYELKRQRLLDDYAKFADVRSQYKKAKESWADTGAPLYQPGEPKSTLESMLDKSKTDENLERVLVSELNANVGQVKEFLASMDESLKAHLLERSPSFIKIFKQNFSFASTQSLKATLDLFQKSEIENQKDIDVPTGAVMRTYLEGLTSSRLALVREVVFKALNKFRPQTRLPPLTGNEVAETARLVDQYVASFQNDVIGYSSLYNLLKKEGFNNLPRPTITEERRGTPSPFIQVPVQEQVVAEARASPMNVAERLASKTKTKLEQIATQYNQLYREAANPMLLEPPIPTSVKKGDKLTLAKAISNRGYNIISQTFDLPAVGVEETKGEELSELPDVPRTPVRYSGSGFARIYRL